VPPMVDANQCWARPPRVGPVQLVHRHCWPQTRCPAGCITVASETTSFAYILCTETPSTWARRAANSSFSRADRSPTRAVGAG
jgi:hypothetical protein